MDNMRKKSSIVAIILVIGVFGVWPLEGVALPDSMASIERVVQESAEKFKSSVVRVKLYAKASRQSSGQGQQGRGGGGDGRPMEASGAVISDTELLIPYLQARAQTEKVEVYWEGKWIVGLILGEDARFGFSIVKVESPQGWRPVRWKTKMPEEGRWGVALLNGGESMNYRVVAAPVWLWVLAKDTQGLGEVLVTTMQPSGVLLLGTFEGEALGLLSNGIARWIDEKYVKAIESSKGSSVAEEGQKTAWYGLQVMPLTPAYVEAKKIPSKKGVRVRSAVPGSPAEAAGFLPHDVVLKLNGKELAQEGASATQELIGLMQVKPDEKVKFSVWREGREMEITCVPAKPPIAKTASSDELGLKVMEILPVNAYLMHYPTEKGVMVTEVTNGGPAMYAKLIPANQQRGAPTMILTEMAGIPVTGMTDFYSALTKIRQAKDQPVFVKGYRGIEHFITVIDPTIGAKRAGSGSGTDLPGEGDEGEEE